MAGTEENTLALGEPNIIVKACVSLKRLLIVTFNIKAIRIQYIYIYIYIGYIYISGYIYIYIYIHIYIYIKKNNFIVCDRCEHQQITYFFIQIYFGIVFLRQCKLYIY